MLTEFAQDVWTVDRGQRFYGLETGTRMTVVRMASGELFVHCPVALDEATRNAVDSLGTVRAVVASSLFHHLYVGQWRSAYPDALICACPGLPEKRADLKFDHVLGDDPHEVWGNHLGQVFFSARLEKEVVFFHQASKTLITADVLLNLSLHPSRVTRAAAWLMGNSAPGKGWLEYFMVRDRKLARGQVDRMLAWDIERVALCHGAQVEREGQQVLDRAYAWL